MKIGRIRDIRIGWCLQVALIGCILTPYLTALLPGGGDYEQRWLDKVVAHLGTLEADPEMQEIIDYTIRRYSHVGRFSVSVRQLPESQLGLNNPFCPGMTIDESVLRESIPFGASIVLHEAMHDYWPHFGHSHIDHDEVVRVTCP
jgi:hypothetical protein